MSVILFLQLIACILVFLLGVFVVWRSPRSLVSWYFGLFTLGIFGWNLSLFLTISELGQPLPWGRLAISFGSLMPAGLYLFSLLFPWPEKNILLKKLCIYSLLLAAIVLPVTNILIQSVEVVDHTYMTGDFTRLYLVYLIYYFGFLLSAMYILIAKYRKATSITKKQLRYVLIGICSFFVPFVITNLILPRFGIFEYNNLGPIFAFPMVLFIGYAIVRHQFLDIRVVIQRGLIYTILLASIVVVYVVLINVLGLFIQQNTNVAIFFAAGVTTIIGIFTVPIIDRYLRRKTDHIFFKDRYVYAEALESLGTIAGTTIELNTLLQKVTSELARIFRADRIQFLLEDTHHERIETLYPQSSTLRQSNDSEFLTHRHLEILTQRDEQHTEAQRLRSIYEVEDIGITLPVHNDGTRLGLMVLGPKRSGDPYTQRDYTLLRTFRLQFGVALEKARLYHEVVEYSEQLEQKVTERTRKITALQKQQKNMMLDISHQLQTPLTVMKGELQILREKIADTNAIDICERSVDSMSTLISNLLRLARLESVETHNTTHKPLALHHILDEIGEYFEIITHTNSDVTFAASLENDVYVRILKDDFTDIVSNILHNALLYRDPQRKNTISLRLTKENGNAVITIADTGIGIHKDDIPHVFERFYRSPHMQTKEKDGTGLGLAIVQRLVEHYNGIVTVDSVLGEGTTFTVRFPLSLYHSA